MRVPRPFDPEEVNQPQGKESRKNIEREEKPIADENQQQSEDFHGGEESTESIPDSPNEGNSEGQEKQQNDDSQQPQNNGESGASDSQQSSSDDSNQRENQQSQSPSKGQGQQPNSNESNNENSTSDTSETNNEQSSSDGKQGESQQPSGKTEGDNNSQSSSETQQSEQTSQSGDSEESVDNEQRETSDSTSQESDGENEETSSDTSNASEEGDTDDDANDTNGQDNETFDSEEEELEVSDSDEESEYQVNSGTYNTNQVFTYVQAKNNTKLSRALYDFIEYVADETRAFNNLSTDYYEPKKLMLRRYQGKSLNATKSGKVRETIVVLLDNSGSMDWVREHVLETARALIQRHDAEIYFAPNGQVECQITKQGEVPVVHGYVINKIMSQQLKVLFIGDFDGAETPIELSWKTKVFWLCPESRYRRFQSHGWVSYDESAFRGFFARTYDAKEMVQALKRFSGFTQFSRYWYDPHEREVFKDD